MKNFVPPSAGHGPGCALLFGVSGRFAGGWRKNWIFLVKCSTIRQIPAVPEGCGAVERGGMNVSWCSQRGPAADPEDLRPCTRCHEGIGQPDPVGDNYPPQEMLEEDIDSNRLFVYVVNGQIEAVFAFILGADPTYAVIEDGRWLNDTLPYGTVHRLASAGRQKGVASAVLEWSLEHCQSLRADTHADNKIMQHLLEKNGFTRCGIIHVRDGSPRYAYQKLAATQPLE